MRATVSKKDFANAISIAREAISEKSPLPILSHFLIKAQTGSLKISATDLEIGVEITIDARVIEEGSFSTPAKTLSDYIGNLPDGDLHLEKEHETLEIKAEHSRFTLMTLPPDEFPLIPRFEQSPDFSIAQKTLKEMIRNVIFAAASKEETRAVLTGVLVTLKQDTLEFITTDGRRLARMKETVKRLTQKDMRFAVPSRTFHEMARALKDPEEEVMVALKGGQVLFDMKDLYIISRVLEGKFPEFEQVIPEYTDKRITVERQKFLLAMKRALIMAQDKENPRLVRLAAKKDRIILRANTPDLGSAYEEIPAIFEGEEVEIAYNGQYFLDVLSNLQEDIVTFDLTSSESPGIIRPKGRENYVYVVMPVRLREEITDEND
jgi:DNA polymerase III subunit beta